MALDKSGKIISSTTKRTYTTRKNVTCKSTNLVYCITCKVCASQYVGQTLQPFMKRVYAHFYSIGKSGETSVARHFSRPDHNGTPDCILYILDFIHAKPDSKLAQLLRDEVQLKRIHTIRTVYPQGINVMVTKFKQDFVSNYSTATSCHQHTGPYI